VREGGREGVVTAVTEWSFQNSKEENAKIKSRSYTFHTNKTRIDRCRYL
jgi:hypothetical protein